MALYKQQELRWGLSGGLNLKKFLALDISKDEKQKQLLRNLPNQIQNEEFALILQTNPFVAVVSTILDRYYYSQAVPEHLILLATAECEGSVVEQLLTRTNNRTRNDIKAQVLETALRRAGKDCLEIVSAVVGNCYQTEEVPQKLLLYAVAECELLVVRKLIDHYINYDMTFSNQGEGVLQAALKREDIDVLEECLRLFNPKSLKSYHVVPQDFLLQAVAKCELPIVNFLLANLTSGKYVLEDHDNEKGGVFETAFKRADKDVLEACLSYFKLEPFKRHWHDFTLDYTIIQNILESKEDLPLYSLRDIFPDQYFSDTCALMVYKTRNQNFINRYLESAYESKSHIFPVVMMQACERTDHLGSTGVRQRSDEQMPLKEMFQQYCTLHKDKISETYLMKNRVLMNAARHSDPYFIRVIFDLFGEIIDPNNKVDGIPTMLECLLSNSNESSLEHVSLFLDMFGEKIDLQKHNLVQNLPREMDNYRDIYPDRRHVHPVETIVMRKLKALERYHKTESFNVFINTAYFTGDTILWHVLRWTKLENIQEFFNLFAKNIDPGVKNEQSETAFITLCSEITDNKLFDEILGLSKSHFQQRININETDETGKSALLHIIAKYVDQIKKARDQAREQAQEEALFDCEGRNPTQIFNEQMGGKEIIVQSLFRHFGSQPIGQTFRYIDPNVQDLKGKFPLQMLVEANDKTGLKTFIDCCKEHGNLLDPNVIFCKTQETMAVTAAKQKKGVLSVIHREFQERYDPTVPDAKGYTVLMLAVFNYLPDFIKELLDHPNIGLLNRNKYKQDIMDIIRGKKTVDERTTKLIEVAYNKQKQAAEKTPDTLDYHIKQAQRVLKSYDMPQKDRASLVHQLDCFLQEVDNISHGRHSADIGMSAEHRKRLQGNRVMLLDELDPKDGPLLDHLYQDNTVTLDQLEEVKSCQTRRSSVEKLLSILPYCGENAYVHFIEALKKSNKGYVADALENYDADKQHSPDEAGALVPVAGGGGVHPENGAVAGGFSLPLQLSSNQQITLAVTVFNNNPQ